MADKKGVISDIIDKVNGTVNWDGLRTLVDDLYDTLKKDLPNVVKKSKKGAAKGCCDHSACCQEVICHLVCALKCEIAHQIACEQENCTDADSEGGEA